MKVVSFIGLSQSGKTSLVEKIATNEESKEENFSVYSLKHGDKKAYLIDSPYDRDDLTKQLNAIRMSNAVVIAIPAIAEVNQFLGELILLAQFAGIKSGLVAITHADSATEDEVNSLKKKMQAILASTTLKDAKIIVTSVVTEEGLDELREEILNLPEYEASNELLFEIDSAKEIKKDLTNVYGFLKGGKLKVHDQVKIMPWGKEFILQSIEFDKENVNEIQAPERVGLGFKGLFPWDVKMGDIICIGDEYKKTKNIEAEIEMVPFYKDKLSKEGEVIVNIGLQTMKMKINKIITDTEVESIEKGKAKIELESEKLPLALKGNEHVIIINPDANWRSIKFAAHGRVTNILQ